jgi:hypothetical protein
VELRGDFTEAEVEKDFSRFGVVDNVEIKKLERGLRVACVDFKNPRVAINAKSAMQEQGKYGTITFWEVPLPRTHARTHARPLRRFHAAHAPVHQNVGWSWRW